MNKNVDVGSWAIEDWLCKLTKIIKSSLVILIIYDHVHKLYITFNRKYREKKSGKIFCTITSFGF